jgi:signal peptidase I
MAVNEKPIFIVLFLLVIIAIGALTIIIPEPELPTEPETESEIAECLTYEEERIVRGSSLSPLIEDGQVVKVIFDYYECNEIERGDIVLYSYAGNEAPLIKIVKGIPGDKFNLQEAEGGWHILINGETVKNSEDIPYLISGKRYQMLSLYEKEYLNGIADNAYLILGNIPSGATDSTRFGFVSAKDILGKVKY